MPSNAALLLCLVACIPVLASAAISHQHSLEVDVAIVGAGWSGLVAAHTLALHNAQAAPEHQLTFHVTEATGHAGGRTLNVDVKTGKQSVATEDVAELGGEWLAKEHTAAIALINETLGFDLFHRLYNVDSAADDLPQRIVVNTAQGTKYCITAKEVLGLLSESVQGQVRKVSAHFKALAKTVPCHGPLPDNAQRLDGISYNEWIIEQGALDLEAQNWLAEYADDAEATNSMSLLGVAWTYNCSNGVVGALDEDYWRVENGTQAVGCQGPALTLAEALHPNITFSSPVTRIEKLPNGHTAVSSSKEVVLAKDVLIAGVSPPVYATIEQVPPLPSLEFQLLSRLTLGTSLKYLVVYETPWWRVAGFLGKIMNTVYRNANKTVYVSECLDNSPGDWSRGVLMCFIEGTQNRDFYKAFPTPTLRQAHIVEFIGRNLQNEGAARAVLRAVEHNWADFPFTRGAYSTLFMPGVLSGFWETWQSFMSHNGSRAMDRLWIAGSDYSGNGLGYIDGAIKSGRAAANLIIERTLNEREKN